MAIKAIDTLRGTLRPIEDIARERTGKRPSPATKWRWRLKGVNGHRLPCVRCGASWMTTAEAFAGWIDSQTATAATIKSESDERSETTRQKLASAGLI